MLDSGFPATADDFFPKIANGGSEKQVASRTSAQRGEGVSGRMAHRRVLVLGGGA